MIKKTLPIYDGAIRANQIGTFLMGGETFHVIRPGYCIQGKRRKTWTQIVHGDIPIYETKSDLDLHGVMTKFQTLWDRHIGGNMELFNEALAAGKKERRRKFRDGKSGEAPAPATTHRKRSDGVRYPT